MRKSRWKQGFARLLILCLLMNQALPVSAQTVAEQEVTPLMEVTDVTETTVEDVAEEVVTEETAQASQEVALTDETEQTTVEDATAKVPDVVGTAEGSEGGVAEEPGEQMPEWMAGAQDLVIGEGISLHQGANYFRLDVTEPGVYQVKNFDNISLQMYDEATQMWNNVELLVLQEVGEYYLQVSSYVEGNIFQVNKAEVTEISEGSVYEKEVPSENLSVFTPKENGRYSIQLSSEADALLQGYLRVYDVNGQCIMSTYYWGGTQNFVLKLDGGMTYYLEMRAIDMTIPVVYSMSMEKKPELDRVEVAKYPAKNKIYTEAEDLGYSINGMEGLLLQLYFKDGTSAPCEIYSQEFYDYGFRVDYDIQYDENGHMKPGEYTYKFHNDEDVEVFAYNITCMSLMEETDVLELNQEKVLKQGWHGFQLNVEEPRSYELKGLTGDVFIFDATGTKVLGESCSVDMPSNISLSEAGKYYILINSMSLVDVKFSINEITFLDLPIGTTGTVEITGGYYSITPEKSGTHSITMSKKDEGVDSEAASYKISLYDDKGTYYEDMSVTGNIYEFHEKLEAGKTYYLRVFFERDATDGFKISVEKKKDAVSIELLQAPYRSQIYYGLENGDYNDLKGYTFGVSFDDGSYLEFKGPSEEWYDIPWNWYIYTEKGEQAWSDDKGYYPVGKYQAVFQVGYEEVKGIIPFSIVSLSDIKDNVLKVEQSVEGLQGETNQAIYNYLAVEIPKAGQYRFVVSANGNMYLYSEDASCLASAWSNNLTYRFEQPGTYYLKVGPQVEEYSVSLEKIKEIVSIDVRFHFNDDVYYYGINEHVKPFFDVMAVLTLDDESTVEAYYTNADWDNYELSAQIKDAETHEVVNWDDKQCYPVGKYYLEVKSNLSDVSGKAYFEVKPLEDYTVELTMDKDVTLQGEAGKQTKADIKVVFPVAGTYVISNNGNGSCTLYDNKHNMLSMGMGAVGTYKIEEPGAYYLKSYHFNEEITFTLDKYYAPVKVEASKYTKELYVLDSHNYYMNLYPEYVVTLENDSTKTFGQYSGVWFEYGFEMQLQQKAGGEWKDVSFNYLPLGEYKLIVYSRDYADVRCELPFKVSSPDKAKVIEMDKEVTNEVRNQVYQINIPEDGAYEIQVIGNAEGYFGFSNEKAVLEAGKGNYNGQKVGMNLKAGKKYLRVYNSQPDKEMTFKVTRMPDISSVSHDNKEKLEVIYGTWGYRISNGISGNAVISVSGNKRPTVPGAKIEGMSSPYKDASGNNIVSGNSAWQETFTFPVTLNVTFENGAEEDIFFNSVLWDIYGFVEKVFHTDGSTMYADESGYAAIGEYVVEFEAQGKNVKIPFSVVESETVKDIRKASVYFEDQIFEGKPVNPIPTVMYGDKELTVDKDYTIRYRDNIQVGIGQAMIIGRGSYSGKLIAEFNIVEREQNRADVAEKLPQNVITDTVKEKTGCETTEQLENYLEETITSNETAAAILPDVKKEDVKVVDITLEMSNDGGKTWEKVTPENFPEEGVDIIIPYPEGMDMFSHDYIIAHLITTGADAGKVEYPEVTKEKEGIKIHINSTSPFAIGWKTVPNPFGDVSESSWAYAFAKYALDYKLMSGKGKDAEGKILFDPTKNMTRAEFVQTLYNKEGKPVVEYTDRFKDVPDNQWYTDAIIWAAENNIVAGKGDKFDVSGDITRQEMATILCKYATNYKKYETDGRADYSKFEDSGKVDKWAKTYMEWALHYGIMKGRADNTLGPLDNATRAEGATMLKNFISRYE